MAGGGSLRREQASRRPAGVRNRSPLAGGLLKCTGTSMGAHAHGGKGAPDDMDQAHRTQVWLAGSDDSARVTGQYFYRMPPRAPNPAVRDAAVQDELVACCQRLSGISLPA
jgi:hypothetical protein